MMYDENEDLGDHRSAMVRFAYNLSHGLPIEVHRGSARGWFHVSDAVNSIERSAHLDDYYVVNIGSPDIRGIDELAEMIRKELDADEDLITYIDIPNRMTLSKNPNLDRQKNILNAEPKVKLEEGVKLICDRMRELVKLGL